MKISAFKKVVIIGFGRIARDVVKYVYYNQKDYGYDIEYVEYEVSDFNQTIDFCDKERIPYLTIKDNKSLYKWLDSIDIKTLIISANNNYLFPAQIVNKDIIRIINFHNALLPDYPGRNAPSWVIFEGKKRTGITWHYVNSDVDAGDIIIQKECRVEADEKAYQLSGRLMEVALDALKECFDKVISDEVDVIEQKISTNRRVYKSSDLPGDGIFSLDDSPEFIYKVLRAMDYGKTGVFPAVKMIIDGKMARVIRYEIIPNNKIKDSDNTIFLLISRGRYLQIKYSFEIE